MHLRSQRKSYYGYEKLELKVVSNVVVAVVAVVVRFVVVEPEAVPIDVEG